MNPRLCLCAAIVAAGAGWPLTPAKADAARVRTALISWQFVEDSPPGGALAPPAAGADWKAVTVPHVFRQSGLPDNTAGWYRQTIRPQGAGESFYLMLDGAATVKDVFVNGTHVGQHKGAFSRCAFDLTPALKLGEDNVLDVRVSNREDEAKDCFSRSTLYYVNGGMFRAAWLVKTGRVHIAPEAGSTGVFLTPRNVTAASAELDAQAIVKNAGDKSAAVEVRFRVKDRKGVECAAFAKTQTILPGETAPVEATGTIQKPQLWDLGQPNLYSVEVEVRVAGAVTDQLTERTGLRTIAWKDQRFELNGREVQFRGVNKHEQTEREWNAVSDDVCRQEWQLMQDMGVNAVRLPHYPHSALEYDIADEHGIAVWAENGYSGQVWPGAGNEEKSVTPDGERLTREMVRQNWNHPAILFWSAGNETVLENVNHYAQIIREENDPSRLVTYAANAGPAKNCDFVANNTYEGWYGQQFPRFAKSPRDALVSETGAGDWITHHVPYGAMQWTVDKFEPEEYAEMFTEFRLQTVCRDAVAEHPMFLWWNFREFYDLKFKLNRNAKGLLTLAGAPKDSYFLFQAFLNPAHPVLHLCGRQHFLRAFAPDSGIKVYANSAEVRLTLNGAAVGVLKNGEYRIPGAGIPAANVFFWKTPLRPGRNIIEVADERGQTDRMIVYQRNPGEPMPEDPGALVQDVRSSNPASPAAFIDRPVEAQGAVYTEVDGSSDNTFDDLPKEIEGAGWIATRRLSDPKMKTDLSFRVRESATVSVLFSTGEYPVVTLKKPDAGIVSAAAAMRAQLKAAGFELADRTAVWRDHDLNRANAELWRRPARAGETVAVPGQTLDYVILAQPQDRSSVPGWKGSERRLDAK